MVVLFFKLFYTHEPKINLKKKIQTTHIYRVTEKSQSCRYHASIHGSVPGMLSNFLLSSSSGSVEEDGWPWDSDVAGEAQPPSVCTGEVERGSTSARWLYSLTDETFGVGKLPESR
jgi:hypothetical protein